MKPYYQGTVYSLCDYSGEWAKPYMEAGCKVVLVDLKYGGDVRLLTKPNERVDIILAAPPCTVFAGSGAKWRSLRATSEVLEGLSIIDACLRFIYACQPEIWALENPVGWLKNYIGEPVMYFDPCDYGDPYTKKTALWGTFNIPDKTPVEPTQGSRIHLCYGGRSERTKTLRSLTPLGFAKAFYEANSQMVMEL